MEETENQHVRNGKQSMAINFNLNTRHRIVAANSHYYKEPTGVRYIDRTMTNHDLIYIIDGCWAITENEQEYTLEKGDVLLLAAGRHHYTSLPCQAGTRTFCIHVSCEDGDLMDSAESLKLPTLLHMQGESSVQHYFEKILSTHWSDLSFKEERLSSLFTLLILELADAWNRQSCTGNNLADRAIAMIKAAPHERISAKDAANHLFVSERTLNNAMHRQTGMPFYSYQKNLKLEMAALQLTMEPDLSLSEIAAAFGFHDQFHFSKAFKQKYSISPQQYRLKNQKEL